MRLAALRRLRRGPWRFPGNTAARSRIPRKPGREAAIWRRQAVIPWRPPGHGGVATHPSLPGVYPPMAGPVRYPLAVPR